MKNQEWEAYLYEQGESKEDQRKDYETIHVSGIVFMINT